MSTQRVQSGPRTPPKLVRSRWPVVEDASTLWIVGVTSFGLLILLARSALDVVVLLILAAALFLLERTIGDWLVDLLGPFGSKVVFIGGVVVLSGVMLSLPGVRGAVWAAIEKADALGFHTLLIDRYGYRAGFHVPPSSSVGGGGGGNPAPVATSPIVSGESKGGGATEQGPPARSTRLVVAARVQEGILFMSADVMTAGGVVDEGDVEFLIDGRSVASASVSRGRAETRLGGVTPGAHRATARYRGTRQFSTSLAETSFVR